MKNNLESICKKSYKHIRRHSPTILSVFGAIGVVGTTVSAIRTTIKATNVLAEKDGKSKKEIAREILPLYIPTAMLGLTTISCILGANMLNKQYQAMLSTAYNMLDQSYKQYRGAANSVFGEDADAKIKAEVAKKNYISCPSFIGSSYVYDPDKDSSEENLFYDFYSERYFTSKLSAVINAQYHINRNLILRGETSLEEYYAFLGIENIENGDKLGWNIYDIQESGFDWLDFDNRFTKMEDGMECYIISMGHTPVLIDD